jgi:hypothetical protein
MTQDDCKLITEKLLGECWHENLPTGYSSKTCFKCGKHHGNRDFQDPQDFFACFDKLVELGELYNFLSHASFVVLKELTRIKSRPQGQMLSNLDNPPSQQIFHYLLSRTESGHYRLCLLCAEWLKEGE